MQISEMNKTELDLFLSLSEKLGIQVSSTEAFREAINQIKKNLELQLNEIKKQVDEQKKYLNELEKMTSNLEKGALRK